MSAPTTIDDFLDCVNASNVVEANRLGTYLADCRRKSGIPREAKALAGLMVKDGIITPFQAQQLLAGRHRNFLIGKYRLLEPLGAGGMNKVFLCEHVVMRHRVAMKMLPRRPDEDPAKVARFFREARAVAALNHPNIVRAHDIDTSHEKFHYIVMEFVDGVSLHDLVARRGSLDPSHAAHYVAQAAAGLQHIHQAGLIHRDIKPANLLLDRTGVVKILDLGLARLQEDDERITERYNDTSILGTVDFISPEQTLIGGQIDIRSDIYCLGATFYFLLTGRVPFEGDNMVKKLIAHQTRDPEPVRNVRPEVPRELSEIQSRMMAKKPRFRFQSPAELLAALEPWRQIAVLPPRDEDMPRPNRGSNPSRSDAYLQTGRPALTPSAVARAITPPVPPARKRNWLRAALVAVATAVVSGLVAWLAAGR